MGNKGALHGLAAHRERGRTDVVGENDFGVLAAHGQQLVHREGGGAEDGLEGDGLDALSPQLTQGGQRDAEGGCEPSDADGKGIAALGAGVGDDRAALVGDSQAGEGRDGCGRGGRAAVRRGRRVPGDNRSFRLHRAGDRDLLGFAISVGGGDFCARAQLVLDGVEVKLIAALREGLAVGTAGLGGQLEAARQIDVVAVDAVAAVAVFAVAAVGSNRTAGDGDTVGTGDAVAAAVIAVAASGFDRTAGDGDAAAAADAVAAGDGAAFAVGSDRTTAGDGDAAAAVDTAAAVVAVGSDRTAGDGEAAAAVAVDAVTTGEMVVAIQLNRGIAAAGHAYGGFVPAAGVDVYILECDLDLIAPGVDGHGVGRSGVLTIFDDGVGVLHILLIPL